jgi:hypothetical protein
VRWEPDNRAERALTAVLASATDALAEAKAKLADALATDSDSYALEDLICDLEFEIEELEELLG